MAPEEAGPDDDRAGGERDGSDDEEWRFAVEDVGDGGSGASGAGASDTAGEDAGTSGREDGPDGDADGGEGVFGPRPDEYREVVPGDPALENALFVVLGVLASLVLVGELVGLV